MKKGVRSVTAVDTQNVNLNIKLILIGVLLAIIIVIGGFLILRNAAYQTLNQARVTPTPTSAQTQLLPTISYQGVLGKDALTLLKENAVIEQDASGMVVSINGRRAYSKIREYWAFYVNGSLASVGAADYQTKDGDKIEWKIEEY